MKKLITIALILALLLPAAALSDLPDISGLSFDELVQLRDQLNLAIWNSQEWQEVIVPIGVYKIGEDIPAEAWTISAASDNPRIGTYIYYCRHLNSIGKEPAWDGTELFYQAIENKEDGGGYTPTSLDLTCKEGMYLIVRDGPAMFTPFAGKQDLGFK